MIHTFNIIQDAKKQKLDKWEFFDALKFYWDNSKLGDKVWEKRISVSSVDWYIEHLIHETNLTIDTLNGWEKKAKERDSVADDFNVTRYINNLVMYLIMAEMFVERTDND